MDSNSDPKFGSLQDQADSLHNSAELGYSSELVLKAMDPMIERRLGSLLDQFENVKPELGPLLDLRAKISEVWRIRRDMKNNMRNGKNAVDVMKRIVEANNGNASGNRTNNPT
ncbi:hypothetical protein LCGC14_2850510 [marine sediment metagenome]|uniref:Uncharacterized protein n=1 Tax=marine sediment metagenome TaxID=412755 RepID=A0A0F9AGS7_9ZZZZ